MEALFIPEILSKKDCFAAVDLLFLALLLFVLVLLFFFLILVFCHGLLLI